MKAGDASERGRDGEVQLDYAVLVKRVREEWGYTQQQLAREVGVTYATINGWERRRHKPIPALAAVLRSLASSEALASASGSSPDDGGSHGSTDA